MTSNGKSQLFFLVFKVSDVLPYPYPTKTNSYQLHHQPRR